MEGEEEGGKVEKPAGEGGDGLNPHAILQRRRCQTTLPKKKVCTLQELCRIVFD